MRPDDFQSLKSALKRLDVKDSPFVLDRMDQFIKLLHEWNGRINLISRQDIPRLMGRHILESIGLVDVISFPSGSHVVDVGTGAGFPGLPIAIVRPDLRMTLVESRRKKNLFLQKVIQTLELENVYLAPGRIEEMAQEVAPADFVLSRAVADIKTLCQWSLPLFKDRPGVLFTIKGMDVNEELADLGEKFPALAPEKIQYHPFPDLPDTRSGQLIQIQFYPTTA